VIRAGNRVREFNHGRVIVGRAKDADFRVDDPNVSRRHAAIFWAEGSLMVMDLDSTNGTMVNGYPVSSSALGPNDVVTIGECRITVETR
jgi:pSer/pThr/pTyr-binding forkhead associated (FHA) protein